MKVGPAYISKHIGTSSDLLRIELLKIPVLQDTLSKEYPLETAKQFNLRTDDSADAYRELHPNGITSNSAYKVQDKSRSRSSASRIDPLGDRSSEEVCLAMDLRVENQEDEQDQDSDDSNGQESLLLHSVNRSDVKGEA